MTVRTEPGCDERRTRADANDPPADRSAACSCSSPSPRPPGPLTLAAGARRRPMPHHRRASGRRERPPYEAWLDRRSRPTPPRAPALDVGVTIWDAPGLEIPRLGATIFVRRFRRRVPATRSASSPSATGRAISGPDRRPARRARSPRGGNGSGRSARTTVCRPDDWIIPVVGAGLPPRRADHDARRGTHRLGDPALTADRADGPFGRGSGAGELGERSAPGRRSSSGPASRAARTSRRRRCRSCRSADRHATGGRSRSRGPASWSSRRRRTPTAATRPGSGRR